MNIKNEQTTALARELADLTGESMTGAVTVAVQERLDRLRTDRANRIERLLRIGRDVAIRLPEPFRSADHGVLLYGDDGLPA